MTFIQHKQFLSGQNRFVYLCFPSSKPQRCFKGSQAALVYFRIKRIKCSEIMGWDSTSRKHYFSCYRKMSYPKLFDEQVKTSKKNLRRFQFSLKSLPVFKITCPFLKRFQNPWYLNKLVYQRAPFKTMTLNIENNYYFKISHFQWRIKNKNLKLLVNQNPFLISSHKVRIIPYFKAYLKIQDFKRQTFFRYVFKKTFVSLKPDYQKWNCKFNMNVQFFIVSINETNRKSLLKRNRFIRNSLKGILLVNFPEKEKNFLIKNLAAENKIALITQSASLLLKDSRNMDDLLGVDDPIQILFDRVKTCIPCICFINNLDSIGKQRYEQEPKSLHWLNHSISLLTDSSLTDGPFLKAINQKNEPVNLQTDNTLANKVFELDSGFGGPSNKFEGQTEMATVNNRETFSHLTNAPNMRQKILTWSDKYQNKKNLYQIRPFFYLLIKLSRQSKNSKLLNPSLELQHPSQFLRQKNIAYNISEPSIFSKLIKAHKTMSTIALKKRFCLTSYLCSKEDKMWRTHKAKSNQNAFFLKKHGCLHKELSLPFFYQKSLNTNYYRLPFWLSKIRIFTKTNIEKTKRFREKSVPFFFEKENAAGFYQNQAAKWGFNRFYYNSYSKNQNPVLTSLQSTIVWPWQIDSSKTRSSQPIFTNPEYLEEIRTHMNDSHRHANPFKPYDQNFRVLDDLHAKHEDFVSLYTKNKAPKYRDDSKRGSLKTINFSTNFEGGGPFRLPPGMGLKDFQNSNKPLFKLFLDESFSLEMLKTRFLLASKKPIFRRRKPEKKYDFFPPIGFKDLGNTFNDQVFLSKIRNKQTALSSFETHETSTFELLSTTKNKHRKNNSFSSGRLKISETDIIKRTALLKFLQILDGFHTNNGSIKSVFLTSLSLLFKPFNLYEIILALPKKIIPKPSEFKIYSKSALGIQNLKPEKKIGAYRPFLFRYINKDVPSGIFKSQAKDHQSSLPIFLSHPPGHKDATSVSLHMQGRTQPKKHDNPLILNSMQNILGFSHGFLLRWTELPKNNELKSNLKPFFPSPISLYTNYTTNFRPKVNFLSPLWPNFSLGLRALKLYFFLYGVPKQGAKNENVQKHVLETNFEGHQCWLSSFGRYDMFYRPKNYFANYALPSFFSFVNEIPKWEIYLKNQMVLKPLNLLCVWPSSIEDRLGPSNFNDGASYILPDYFQLLGHGPKLKKQGITLIASTKNLTTLDAALLRPGRFDTIINFSQSFSSIYPFVKSIKHSPSLTHDKHFFSSKLNFKQKEILNVYVWPSSMNIFKPDLKTQTGQKKNLDQNCRAREKQISGLEENQLFVLKGSVLNNANKFSSIPNLEKFRFIKKQFYPQVTVLDIPKISTSIKTFMDISVFIQYKLWWSFNHGKLSGFRLYENASIEKPKIQVLDSEKLKIFKASSVLLLLESKIYKLKHLTNTVTDILQIFFFRFFYNVFQFSVVLKQKITKNSYETGIQKNDDGINALGREILISKAVMDYTQKADNLNTNYDSNLSSLYSSNKEPIKNQALLKNINFNKQANSSSYFSTISQAASYERSDSKNTSDLSPVGGFLPKNLHSLNSLLKPYYLPNLEAWKLPNCRKKSTKNSYMEQNTMFLKSNRSLLFCTGDFDYSTCFKKEFILGSRFDWISSSRGKTSLSKIKRKSGFTQSINLTTALLDFSSKIWKPVQVELLKRVNVNNAMLTKYNEIYKLKTIKLTKQYFFNFRPLTKPMLKRWPELKKSNKLKQHILGPSNESEGPLKISQVNKILETDSYTYVLPKKFPFDDDASNLETKGWFGGNQNLYSGTLLIPTDVSLLKKESSKFFDSFLATDRKTGSIESYLFRKTSKNSSLNLTCLQIYPTLTSAEGLLKLPSISSIHQSQKPNYFQTFLDKDYCLFSIKKIPRKTNSRYNFQISCTVRCYDYVKTNERKLNNNVILLKNSNLVSNEKKEHNLNNTHESFFQNYKMCQLDVSFFLLTFYTMFFAKIIYKKTTLNTIKILMPYKSLIISHFLLSQNEAYGFSCKNFEILIYNKLKNFLETPE